MMTYTTRLRLVSFHAVPSFRQFNHRYSTQFRFFSDKFEVTNDAKSNKIHPLVRDLYKRAILVGKRYPPPAKFTKSDESEIQNETGIEYVRRKWKKALRDPSNFSPFYGKCPPLEASSRDLEEEHDGEEVLLNERELRRAVGRGRAMIREMEGLVTLHKYRSMKQRYG
mmetsp:Transcript_28345/g.64834  ORF Transcript_28345/g.64834 Transcript_28345/m.64834 type:complete len:168 (-) Transcript_28345:176-679(-)